MNSPTLLYMFIINVTVDALPSAEIMQEIKDTVQDEIAIEIVEVAIPQVFFMRDTVDTDIDICLECPIDVIGIYYAPCSRSGARKVYKMDSKSIKCTFSHRQQSKGEQYGSPTHLKINFNNI